MDILSQVEREILMIVEELSMVVGEDNVSKRMIFKALGFDYDDVDAEMCFRITESGRELIRRH